MLVIDSIKLVILKHCRLTGLDYQARRWRHQHPATRQKIIHLRRMGKNILRRQYIYRFHAERITQPPRRIPPEKSGNNIMSGASAGEVLRRINAAGLPSEFGKSIQLRAVITTDIQHAADTILLRRYVPGKLAKILTQPRRSAAYILVMRKHFGGRNRASQLIMPALAAYRQPERIMRQTGFAIVIRIGKRRFAQVQIVIHIGTAASKTMVKRQNAIAQAIILYF